ncbi:signal peptidase II [Buchnera aphidicola]|uniref:Lipoprotein signal peptidase n=1 Tax=Buchnera aphidicola (Anoecia oenotherae) TaxID=1241833 RepID=A0A4D6Y069_9GAMM|nr:signal peptidase II [Buchnera aphidicola]QCI19251.1 signal peptidase II [Buchnera aphidicola (Anoecia oenotherae)]
MKKTFSFISVKNFLLLSLIIALDFYSKKWIIHNYCLLETTYITYCFNILRTHNYGSAFGFLSEYHFSQNWFIFFTIFIVLLLSIQFFYFLKRKEEFYYTLYLFIVAGSIGNLLDRINYGYVIDFVDLHLFDWHTCTFNVADVSIFIGSTFLFM